MYAAVVAMTGRLLTRVHAGRAGDLAVDDLLSLLFHVGNDHLPGIGFGIGAGFAEFFRGPEAEKLVAARLGPSAIVATIVVDSGLRYLTTDVFRSA